MRDSTSVFFIFMLEEGLGMLKGLGKTGTERLTGREARGDML